ncbi:MAG: glycosyltransferase family 39 protein, partial [Acidobacteriota bacterium]
IPAFTWPDAEATLTPLGFTRGQSPGVIAPKYPPGLPLLLAPLTLVSETAIYFLVPLLGALTIWILYRLGVGFGDPTAGAAAACLLAASPTFLYQVVQPMSDVPVTACWLGALLIASRGSGAAAVAAGAISSLAVMIRPNLAPIAAIVLIPAVFSRPEARVRRTVLFAAALLPGVVTLGWIQQVRYGSPLASGYGSIHDGFSLADIPFNLARYPRWLTESHTAFIWLSLLAPWWIATRAARPLLASAAALLSIAIWAAYLPYVYFQPNEWFYTRFLLPAIAVMLLFASVVSLWGLRRLWPVLRLPVTAVLLAADLVTCLHSAQTLGAFDLRAQEQKYPLAGAFVRDRLPQKAFVLASQHSGSIRYYANRPTLRWDLLAPGHLDETLGILRAQGQEPFLVVDAGEDDEFRRRFEAAGQRAVRAMMSLAVCGDARVYGFQK